MCHPRVEPASVVADLQVEVSVAPLDLYIYSCGVGMLEDVGQALGDEEVCGALNIIAEPSRAKPWRGGNMDIDRQPAAAVFNRLHETAVGEHAWMNSLGQFA